MESTLKTTTLETIMEETKLETMYEIGNYNHLIYIYTKKIDNRKKIKKYLLQYKIYHLLKIINKDNPEWEFQNDFDYFYRKYKDDSLFFKNNIIYIFFHDDIAESQKQKLPIMKDSKHSLKTFKYLLKNKSRITASTNTCLNYQDYINFYEALIEDEEQLLVDIYKLHRKIHDLFNNHKKEVEIKNISIIRPSKSNLKTISIKDTESEEKKITKNEEKNEEEKKEEKHVHFPDQIS
jgi:hypothetical protein